VGDDVGEPEVSRTPGYLLEQLCAVQRVHRGAVQQQVAVDGGGLAPGVREGVVEAQ
jgi:hypothetical protein